MLAIVLALKNKPWGIFLLISRASSFIVASITKGRISSLLASAKIDCFITIALELYWGDRSGFVASITKGLVLA